MSNARLTNYDEATHYKICQSCGNRIYNGADKIHVCTYNEEE